MPPTVEEVQDKDKKPSSEDSTQQTNSQVDPPINEPVTIDPNYVADLERRIGEQQIQFRTLQRLAEENTRIREETKDNQPPPSRDIVADRNAFYADPIGKFDEKLDARDKKILQQMEKMLEPIKDVAASFKTNSEYDRLKAIVKNDPVFGKGLKDPDVEAAVDNIARQGGFDLTEDNIRSLVAQTMGVKAMGGLRGSNGNRTTTTTTQERIDPPQVPTSRTRSQVPDQTKELTEDDRLGMKFAKLNPNNPEDVKEYWALMNDETMTLSVHKKGDAK